ncbi:anhydro-N-acetylmuramic acid kinase [Cytophagaceae bacterium AH-315-L13]|nr:anhydro-N-acetylmuramic acid kinase [Cytophagaceae bacterium AH-315-L13]
MYKVIGIMSGTSLDGVDLAYCVFKEEDGIWTYDIYETETIEYNEEWKGVLNDLINKDDLEILKADKKYGTYLGELVRDFIKSNSLEVELIASHGHTIKHQPEKGITLQIGDGQQIANVCQKKVVCNFRKQDVELGGEGAPLVPIGDLLLFGDHKYCLNLGGIANISIKENNSITAFDICPCNMVLNELAGQLNLGFDKDGENASKGEVNNKLLNKLNNIEYCKKDPPKSLGREDIMNVHFPIINEYKIDVESKLRTFVEHIAIQISNSIQTNGAMLVTGGGAWNEFLIKRIKELTDIDVNVPQKELVDYKEALIFGLLGILKVRDEINCLSSVTGASEDCVGGEIFSPE